MKNARGQTSAGSQAAWGTGLLRLFRTLFFLVVATHADAREVTFECPSSADIERIALPNESGEIGILLSGEQGAWIEVAELGQSLQTQADSAQSPLKLLVPLRYGWIWQHLSPGQRLTVARLQKNNAPGFFEAKAHCDISGESGAAPLHWIARATGLLDSAGKPLDNKTVKRVRVQPNYGIGDMAHLTARAAELTRHARCRTTAERFLLKTTRRSMNASALSSSTSSRDCRNNDSSRPRGYSRQRRIKSSG
jgi:hypothetical protein